MGMVERKGNVISSVIDDVSHKTIAREIRKNIAVDSTLITDEWKGYNRVSDEYFHYRVNHSTGEYVREHTNGAKIHTNTIENYWSLVKRMIKGTYIHVEPFHLDRYLQEQSFRYNTRKGNDSERFNEAASQVFGTTLTYAELTGKLQ